MNKYLKLIIIFLMALASTISFSKIYGDYQNYQLIRNNGYNEYTMNFNLDINKLMDEDKALDDFFKAISENNLIVTNMIRGNAFYYYNPDQKYANKIKNYQKNCRYKCLEMKEMKKSDFIVKEGYNFISLKKIEPSIFKNPDIILNLNELHDGEKTEVQKQANRIIFLYELNFIVFICIIFSLILLSFVTLLKNIKKMQLQSILGFKFSTSFLENYKETILKDYLTYSLLTVLLLIIYSKELYNPSIFMFFSLLILIIITLMFYIISLFLNSSLARGTTEKFTKNSILILSLIIIIFNMIIIITSARVYYNFNVYSEQVISNENLKDYYTATLEKKISLKMNQDFSNYMIDRQEGVFRSYQREVKELIVDKNFFEEYKDYLKIDGRDFDFNKDYKQARGVCLHIITKNNKEFNGQCNENKYLYIDNTDAKINTLDLKIPQVKLNEIAIMHIDTTISSNLIYKANSIEEVHENIQNAYEHFGINENLRVAPMYDPLLLNQAKTNLIDGSIALICSLFSIIIATSFYSYMIFLRNKNEMVLGIIMGYTPLKAMKKSFSELFITTFITLMILIFLEISIFSFTLFVILFLIQLFIIYYNTKKLIQKSIVNFVKGEV